MADKKITDVDFIGSLNGDESFFVNHNDSIKQIKMDDAVFGIVSGGTGARSASEARKNLEAQKQHVAVPVILSVGEWADNAQTVYVNGITDTNTIIVTPAPASKSAYAKAEVYCCEQMDNALVFECEELPEVELMVNILILS